MIAQVETIVIKSADFSHLTPIGEAVLDFLTDKTDANTAYGIQLAVNEACANIIEHAYENTEGTLSITFSCEQNQFIAELQETGRSFCPNNIPAPDLDVINEGGLGLFLIRTLMDDFAYTATHEKNVWRLTKQL